MVTARCTDDRTLARDPPKGAVDTCAIVSLFNAEFTITEHTELRGGAVEPVYTPSQKAGEYSIIYFREDYIASALHEVAHWCLAGAKRRRLEDYGYWYVPERSSEQQRLFEQAEVKPQALEWLFSVACGHAFHVSRDHFGVQESTADFPRAVALQAQQWCSGEPLPSMGAQFIRALSTYYQTDNILQRAHYCETVVL